MIEYTYSFFLLFYRLLNILFRLMRVRFFSSLFWERISSFVWNILFVFSRFLFSRSSISDFVIFFSPEQSFRLSSCLVIVWTYCGTSVYMPSRLSIRWFFFFFLRSFRLLRLVFIIICRLTVPVSIYSSPSYSLLTFYFSSLTFACYVLSSSSSSSLDSGSITVKYTYL